MTTKTVLDNNPPPYDPAVCLQDLQDSGLTPACQTLSPPWHCQDLTTAGGAYHSFCANAGILYQPIAMLYCGNPQTGVSKYFPPSTMFQDCAALGAPWQGGTCYCCCSCFANDTLIAIPDGSKQIFLFQKGDEVLTGAAGLKSGKIQLSWESVKVSFSSGTDKTGYQPLMVYMSLKGKERMDLICNMQQPFLLADGKYTTAGRLVPGQQLVDKDGDSVLIELISLGSYQGGVHHISTNIPWNKSPDGHLLLAGGVVAGDYTMQMYFDQLPDSMKESDYQAKPLMGTPEYKTTHAKLRSNEAVFEFVSAGLTAEKTKMPHSISGLFKTYSMESSSLPFSYQSIFNPAQAADIAANGRQTPVSNPIPESMFNTIRAQLTGFFPDIDFYYDTLEVTPNVYAFEAYGRKVVQLNGGLARLIGMSYEGLFMAMAHGVACFYGGAPKNIFGYSGVGQADWFAFGVISRLTWVGQPYVPYITAAINQWKTLFSLVSPQNAGGNPMDPVNDPSLACRMQAIQSAAGGGALPECAGGEPQDEINLEKAEATALNEVILTLSLAVDADSAANVKNYTLDPAAKILSASLDPATGFLIRLETDLAPATDYKITIQDLVSILGTGVDPVHDSASFRTIDK